MKRKDDPEDLNEESLRNEEMRLCSLHHKWLKELFVVIRGNGDPKHGIEWKVQKLLDNQGVVLKVMWVIMGFVALRVGEPIFEEIVKLISQHKV